MTCRVLLGSLAVRLVFRTANSDYPVRDGSGADASDSRMEEAVRPVILLVITLLSLSAGCANQQLRYSTLKQTSTLADIQESQVMENFARLAANPGALPFLSLANTGSATVTDEGSGSLSFIGVARAFTSGTYGLARIEVSRSTGDWLR